MSTGYFILAYDSKSFVMLGNSQFFKDFGNFLQRSVKTAQLTAVKFLGYLFYRTFMKCTNPD